MSFVPWLKFGGHEIANYNRTVSYIENGLIRDGRVNAAPGCGCDAIDEGPYDTPATDEAPWYTSARPESGDFLGMILDRIDINGPFARSVTARGGNGSVIGPERLRGRVLSFRGILYAASPQAMDYGKRWLAEALRDCGSLCGLGDLCLLPACPEGEADEDQFFRTLKRTALIDGPTEVEIPGIPCDLITRMDWQMGAEVGYLYADPELCMDEQVIVAEETECCILSTEEWIGSATAVVTITAGSPNRVEGLRIVATPTKNDVCPPNPDLAQATPCSEFVVSGLKPGTQLVIDGTERTVEVREVTSGRVVGGLEVVTPEAGLFDWIDVGACSSMCICASVDAGGQVNADTRVSVEQVLRET